MTQDVGTTSEAAAPRKRRRWLRRLAWLAVVLVLLVVGAGVAVHFVLASDWPRRIVVAEVEEKLGLRFSAKSLRTTLLGRAELRDVAVGLPLDDEDLLVAPALNVRVTALPLLALGWPVEVESVEVERPTVYVRQASSGEWNVARAAELLVRLAGKEQAEGAGTKRRAALKLPRVEIREGTVDVKDNRGRAVQVGGVKVAGNPGASRVWEYEMEAGGRVTAKGRLAAGGDWRHEVGIEAKELGEWVRPWVGRDIGPTVVKGDWGGRVAGGKVDGTLRLREGVVGQFGAAGSARVTGRADGVEVVGEVMKVTTGDGRMPDAVWRGGKVVVRTLGVEVADAVLDVAGGHTRVNGNYAFGDAGGQVSAEWADVRVAAAVTSGGMTVAVSEPWPGQYRAEVGVTSTGTFAGGGYEVKGTVAASGSSWREGTAEVAFPVLTVSAGRRRVDLSTLAAKIAAYEGKVELTSLTAPPPYVTTARASADLGKGVWDARVTLAAPEVEGVGAMRVELGAAGDRERLEVQRITATAGEAELTGTGTYVFTRPKPLEMKVTLRHPARGMPGSAVPATRPVETVDVLTGRVTADVRLEGTLAPLDLDLAGALRAEDAAVRGRPVGDVVAELTGRFERERAHLATTELKLFSGQWRLTADYPADSDATTRPTGGGGHMARVGVAVRNLSVEDAASLLRVSAEAKGTVGAALRVDVPLPRWRGATVAGGFVATDLAYAPAGLRPDVAAALRAERAAGRVVAAGGTVVLDELVLENGGGRVTGRVSVPVAAITKPSVEVRVTDWPVAMGHALAAVSAQASLAVDLKPGEAVAPGPMATGPVAVSAKVSSEKRGELAVVSARGTLGGRAVTVDELAGRGFTGELRGAGFVDVDRIERSTFDATFDRIDLAKVAELTPVKQDVRGMVSGTARLARATGPRPLEQLELKVAVDPQGAAVGGASVGAVRVLGYVGRNRVVVDRSSVDLAGGQVRVWARTSRHEPGVRSSQATLEFDSLDLDQLVHAVKPDAEAMPGRVAGHLTLLASTADPRALYGSGTVDLSRSDLANFDVFTALYAALNAGTRAGEPSGRGTARVRLERGDLIVTDFSYFNRGTEAHAAATVADVFAVPGSKLAGTVVGTATPLSQIKLPLFADADDIFRAVQSAATTLKVSGTVGDPKVEPATVAELSESVRRMLLGGAGKE